MEIEIKYSPVSWATFKNILDHLSISAPDTIEMEAAYYDDCRNTLGAHRSSLRCRRENEQTLWTLKTTETAQGGLSHRQEYECRADSVEQAVTALLPYAIPRVATALQEPLTIIAQMTFTRTQAIYTIEQTAVILSYDSGTMRHRGARGTIGEMEIELKCGEQQQLLTLAAALQSKFGLTPDPISKLQKALSL